MLQKVQPLIAIAAARVILGEEPRRRFAWFVIPALLGVWLIAFPQPFDVHAQGIEPMALALGAAVLWGLGTVFGRYLARRLRFDHIVTVRFSFGLVASAIALPILGAPAFASAHDTLWIAYLALVDRPARAVALLHRPAADSRDGRVDRGARVPGDGDHRRLRRVRRDAALDAVARRVLTVGVVSLLPAPRRTPLVRTPALELELAPASA